MLLIPSWDQDPSPSPSTFDLLSLATSLVVSIPAVGVLNHLAVQSHPTFLMTLSMTWIIPLPLQQVRKTQRSNHQHLVVVNPNHTQRNLKKIKSQLKNCTWNQWSANDKLILLGPKQQQLKWKSITWRSCVITRWALRRSRKKSIKSFLILPTWRTLMTLALLHPIHMTLVNGAFSYICFLYQPSFIFQDQTSYFFSVLCLTAFFCKIDQLSETVCFFLISVNINQSNLIDYSIQASDIG